MGTVLIVDDEARVRQVASRMLARLGYGALEAGSGAQAIDVYRRQANDIDCVIVDLAMPGMDGQATLRALREVRGDVCVVLASGFGEEEVMRRYAEAGFAGFIQKPFTMAGLREKLEDVLHSKAL